MNSSTQVFPKQVKRVSRKVQREIDEDYQRRLRDATRIAGTEHPEHTSEFLAQFWFEEECDFCGRRSLDKNHSCCYEWSHLHGRSIDKEGN